MSVKAKTSVKARACRNCEEIKAERKFRTEKSPWCLKCMIVAMRKKVARLENLEQLDEER